MNDFILEERGYFWLELPAISTEDLAPASRVAGLLKINNEGRITLQLDGVLSGINNVPSCFGDDFTSKDHCIQGILIQNPQKVLLLGAKLNRGIFSGGGVSRENYSANTCLVGDDWPDKKAKYLHISLEGYDQFFRIGSIESTRTLKNIRIRHTRKKDISYQLDDGVMVVRHNIDGPPIGTCRSPNLSLTESISIIYKTKRLRDIVDMTNMHSLIEDFFVILTDSGCGLNWPELSIGVNSQMVTCYYSRIKKTNTKFEWYKSPTNFILIKDHFGSMMKSFIRKRDEYGPGLNLYLATRRGINIYEEYRFIMLISGIESFHRRSHPVDAGIPTNLQKKIQRILDCITCTKDKEWLEKKLQHASEPTLEERVCETLVGISPVLNIASIKRLSKKCADYRNDISHFGELRIKEGTYNQRITDLHDINGAISKLYHALLIKHIGLPDDMLTAWLGNGHINGHIRLFNLL